MTEEPNVYAYFINSIVMLFLLMVFFGFMHKIAQLLSAIFAYPVYLAMYAFEDHLRIKPQKRHFLQLNIPKENPRKKVMNFCASLVVFFMLPNIFKLNALISSEPELASNVMLSLFFGSSDFQMWSNLAVIFFIFLIYSISYFTELDGRDPSTKIEELSVPSLWKNILKKI